MAFICSPSPSVYFPYPHRWTGCLGTPLPLPESLYERADGRAYATKFSRPHGFTKYPYPWCSAGALGALELHFKVSINNQDSSLLISYDLFVIPVKGHLLFGNSFCIQNFSSMLCLEMICSKTFVLAFYLMPCFHERGLLRFLLTAVC